MISAGKKVDVVTHSPAILYLRGHQEWPLVHPGGWEDDVGDLRVLTITSVNVITSLTTDLLQQFQ